MPDDEANFYPQTYNLTEVLLVQDAMATVGPESHPTLDLAMQDGSRPLTIVTLSGGVPVAIETDPANDTDRRLICGEAETTSILPIMTVAMLYASFEEVVRKWPDTDRTRFHALVDQYRMNYRDADTRYRAGQ